MLFEGLDSIKLFQLKYLVINVIDFAAYSDHLLVC